MKWSWKVAKLSGIDVYIHSTFLILIGWIALSHWLTEKNFAAVVEGVTFILALFGCVVLHEFGHALAARRFGVKTADITLLPIGGVARLERMPEKPWEEFVVAIAGPLVNVVIAALIFVVLVLSGSQSPISATTMTDGPFLQKLMVVNLALVVFNMLPAFPMDGGRVLRAVLATQTDYSKATQIAASVGQSVALMLGFLGLFSNPFLVFIALFVWIGAAQEAATAQMKSAIEGIPVRDAMLTNFLSLATHAPLSDAIELTLQGTQKDFPVVSENRVVGVLSQADMLAALSKQGPETFVREVMQPTTNFAEVNEMLASALNRIEECGCHTLPVMRQGQLVGLLTMDNIGEYLRIHAALHTHDTSQTSTANHQPNISTTLPHYPSNGVGIETQHIG